MSRFLFLVLLLSLVACNDKSNSPTQLAQLESSRTTTSATATIPADDNTTIQLNQNIDLGIPVSSNVQNEILISRKQYVLSWNNITRNLNWAAWKLAKENLGGVKRGRFNPDPDLGKYLQQNSLGKSVITTDYTNSCFNRGHTVPSADRNLSAEDNNTTFYMSNITPQTAFLNQVAWGHLEYHERFLAQQGKTLYIYAGPIYDKDLGAIGPERDIKIPTKFFKIIVQFDENDTVRAITPTTPMIVVIMPNTTSAGTWPDEDRETLCKDSQKLPSSKADFDDWKKYQTSLEELETQSGLKFFEPNTDQILSPIIIAA